MDETDQLRRFVFRMQIIAGLLIAGVLAFLLVTAIIVHTAGPQGGGPIAGNVPLITIVCVALSLSQIPIALVLPGLITDAGVKRLRLGQPLSEMPASSPMIGMLQVLNSAMVMRMAMLEGGAFAAIIAYLIEGSYWALPGVVAPVLLMLWHFPSADGCQRQLEQIAQQLTEPASQ